jgi:outer membrane protein OmpA-like peptidoglycan-associated protein
MKTFMQPQQEEAQQEEHWLSISDLMTALMMIFLFISIVYMQSAQIEKEKIKEIAVSYQENQVNLYQNLMQEFEEDLPKWQAFINPDTLAFEFQAPEVLFDRGDIRLNPLFQDILSDFFPRYLKVIKPFKASINEIRIEGHTSSLWGSTTDDTQAYFHNMRLSQGRTRSVLAFIFPLVSEEKSWIKHHMAAVGFSSAKVIVTNGHENYQKSRRVSFRIITNAHTQIKKILDYKS